MDATCAVCETEFDAARSTAKYCGDRCRQISKRRRGAEVSAEPDAATPKSKPAIDGRKSALAAAVRKELAEADRLDTVAGQSALLLAEQASATGATGVAGLLKELRTAMAEALVGAKPKGPVAKDQVAEARKRRDAKKARQAAHRA